MSDELKDHIQRLREDFSKGSLNEADVNLIPAVQFQQWLKQAVEARITEVQAVTLATATQEGKPSSRIVYLREFEADDYYFYTNYNSRKSIELENNPQASFTFFWKELERQIRIEGTVQRAASDRSDSYFNARPFDSKIGAWASAQSSVLNSREDLDKKIKELKNKYTPENITRPDFWGGYVLKANYYEFWQGRNSRLHDRITYSLNEENQSWKIERLSP